MNMESVREKLQQNSNQKPSNCPGFNIAWSVDYGVLGLPIPKVNYDPETKKPITVLCTHECWPSHRPGFQYSCQPWANYAYVLLYAYAQGHINLAQWKALFPSRFGEDFRGKPWYGPMRASPQCHGFFLTQHPSTASGSGILKGRDINAVDLCPYTKPCYHQQCDPSALVKFAFYRAYATGLLVEMNLDIDAENVNGKNINV